MGAWGRNVLIIQEGLMLCESNSASSPRLSVFFFMAEPKQKNLLFFLILSSFSSVLKG